MRVIRHFSLRYLRAIVLLPSLALLSTSAHAQQLQTKFVCNATRDEDGEKVIYADGGEIRLDGNKVEAFHWESAQYRSMHGFDCSVDESDEPVAEASRDGGKDSWRVTLRDAAAARQRRGYDFFNHGMNCSIRLQRDGNNLNIKPSCPALCGSRINFTELSVDLKTGTCRYEE